MSSRTPIGYLNGFLAYDWNRPLAKPGVYRITCLANGKCYVGASGNMKSRFGNGYNTTKALEEDIKFFGRRGFIVEPIYYCLNDSAVGLELIESLLILEHNALSPAGYNSAHSLFGRRPDNSSAASKSSTALWQDLLYRAAVLTTRASIQPLINEALADAWRRGYDERVAAMQTKEHQEKLALGQYRRHLDPNEGAKLSRSAKHRWKDTSQRLAQSAIQTAFASTSEGKQVKSRATKGKVWVTDGKTNTRVAPDKIPDGWRPGRTNDGNLGRWKKDSRNNTGKEPIDSDTVQGEFWSHGVRGSRWITDGVTNKRNPKGRPIPEGWRDGRSRSSKRNDEVEG